MKRLISFFIVLVFLFPTTAFSNDENLIKHIICEQIPVLSEYSEVTVSPSEFGYVASFSELGKNPATVNTDSSGKVLNYSLSYLMGVINKLPTVTKQGALNIAKNFLSTAASDIIAQLDFSDADITYSGVSTSEYSVHLQRVINSIPYASNSVTIWIDGHSGTVIRYLRSWEDSLLIDTGFSIMPLDMAQAEYSSKIGISLKYLKTAEGEIKLVYSPENNGYINAVDSSVIVQNSGLITSWYDQIIAKIQKINLDSVVPIEKNDSEAVVKAAEKFAKSRGFNTLSATSVKFYYTDSSTLAEVTLKTELGNIKILLDISDYSLVGFYSPEVENSVSSIPEDKLLGISDNFIKTYFAKYVPELNSPVISSKTDNNGTVFEINYTRTVNDIPFHSNGAQILINGFGEVVSASVIWDNAHFSDTEGIFQKEAAEKLFFEKIGIVPSYTKTKSNKLVPIYTVNPAIPNIIDAISGQVLSYDGSVSKQAKDFKYTDIDSHYSKKQANALLDCGIFISSGEVSLDGYISQKDFIKLLANIFPKSLPVYGNTNRYLSDSELEMLYNFFVTENVLEKAEINPNGLITRENAVKYIINATGYRDVANFKGIFLETFNDFNEVSPSLYGYIALAKGFGIITGSGQMFHPKDALTNGDALIMIYNYLK